MSSCNIGHGMSDLVLGTKRNRNLSHLKKGMWHSMLISWIAGQNFSFTSFTPRKNKIFYKFIFRPYIIIQFLISVEYFEYSGFWFSFDKSRSWYLLCISKMVSLKSSQNALNNVTFILLYVMCHLQNMKISSQKTQMPGDTRMPYIYKEWKLISNNNSWEGDVRYFPL